MRLVELTEEDRCVAAYDQRTTARLEDDDLRAWGVTWGGQHAASACLVEQCLHSPEETIMSMFVLVND